MNAASHPCFRCTLPDCDDASPNCALRRAYNLYNRAVAKREPVSDQERSIANLAYTEFYLDGRYGRAPFDAVRAAEKIERWVDRR